MIVGQPMTFAGRGRFNQPNATAMQTITMDANAMMEELHDRMPVILERRIWLHGWAEVAGDPAALLKPAGNEVLMVWPVSKQGGHSEEQWGGIFGGGR